uniref:Uncharacterized protein n=1 Tax=Ciona savignyi TaxID=51511 RepID=H2Y8Z2_CIOSA
MPTLVIQSSTGGLPQTGSPALAYHSPMYNTPASNTEPPYYMVPSFHAPQAAKASSLKKRDDGFNYLLSPTDGRDRHDWASNYVPDCFTVKGRTFKDYVLGYLSAVDAHTLKSAIEQFYSFRNLDVFIIQIYPIVDSIPAGGQQILAFLQYLMTSEEREKFKIKLTDLANFNVADALDCHEGNDKRLMRSQSENTWHSPSHNAFNRSCSENPAIGISNPLDKTRPARVRRKHSLRNSVSNQEKVSVANSGGAASAWATGGQESTGSTASTPTKRNRRRRTVGNIQFSGLDRSRDGAVDTRDQQGCDDTPPVGEIHDADFYDQRQQNERRRRRELAPTSRRRRSIGVVSSPPYPSSENRTPPDGILKNSRRQRSSRRTVEIFTTTTTMEETICSMLHDDTSLNQGS